MIYMLDLRGTICPFNYVKTKLKLEEMEDKDVLEVIIDDGEPIRNVPRSIKEDGYKILSITKFGNSFRLLIEKDGKYY